MIKKNQTLKSMANSILDKGLGLSSFFITDPNSSIFGKCNSFRTRVCNVRSCGGDFRDKVPKLRCEDVLGFHRMRALALCQQPVSEDKLVGGSKNVDLDEFRSVSEKVVIAVDVDEVLGNFVSALNRFIAVLQPIQSLNIMSTSSTRFGNVRAMKSLRLSFLVNPEYSLRIYAECCILFFLAADIRVHEFFKTTYFKNGIYPLPGAQNTLNKLSSICSLSVVTSRQNVIKDHTLEWLEKHYPGLFKEIHFGNHFALDGESKPKSEICRSMGAKVLIDDNPRYAMECAEIGVRVLLFDYENSYPWCKTGSSSEHPLVTKVHNWDEVEQHLLSWIFSSDFVT